MHDRLAVGVVMWGGFVDEVLVGDREEVDRLLCNRIGVPEGLHFIHFVLAQDLATNGPDVLANYPRQVATTGGMEDGNVPSWYNHHFEDSMLFDNVEVHRRKEEDNAA